MKLNNVKVAWATVHEQLFYTGIGPVGPRFGAGGTETPSVEASLTLQDGFLVIEFKGHKKPLVTPATNIKFMVLHEETPDKK